MKIINKQKKNRNKMSNFINDYDKRLKKPVHVKRSIIIYNHESAFLTTNATAMPRLSAPAVVTTFFQPLSSLVIPLDP